MPDPVIELGIFVGGTSRARTAIPARKAKVLLADILPDGGTIAERAEALLAFVIRNVRDHLSEEAPLIGNGQYDVMLAAVREADPTWDQAKVVAKGMEALEAAYDQL